MNQQPERLTTAPDNSDRKVRRTFGSCPFCNTTGNHKKIDRDTLNCVFCHKQFEIYVFSPSLEETSVDALHKGNPRPLIKTLKAGKVSFVKNNKAYFKYSSWSDHIAVFESDYIVICVDENEITVIIDNENVDCLFQYGITQEKTIEICKAMRENIPELNKYKQDWCIIYQDS
jgi:hypothetical protein